jgi:hypothetical protein
VFGIVRAASLLAATVLTFVWGAKAIRALHADDVVFLAGAVGVTLVLGWLRAPAAHFERSVRPTPDSDRVGLLTTVLIAVLVREGWFWAAWCALAAQLVRPPGLRRRPFFERFVTAALRFPALGAGVLVAGRLRDAVAAPPSLTALIAFAAVGCAYVLAVDLLWFDPLAALRQTRSLLRIWRHHLTDGATVATIVAETCWAYVIVHVAKAEGALLGVLLMLPLVVLGAVLLRLAHVNARLHRLALSRQAVDAMLHATDP